MRVRFPPILEIFNKPDFSQFLKVCSCTCNFEAISRIVRIIWIPELRLIIDFEDGDRLIVSAHQKLESGSALKKQGRADFR